MDEIKFLILFLISLSSSCSFIDESALDMKDLKKVVEVRMINLFFSCDFVFKIGSIELGV